MQEKSDFHELYLFCNRVTSKLVHSALLQAEAGHLLQQKCEIGKVKPVSSLINRNIE